MASSHDDKKCSGSQIKRVDQMFNKNSNQSIFWSFLFSEPRLDKNPFGNGFGPPGGPGGLNPMAAQFMALQHPAFLSAAQVNAAGGMPAPFGLPNPSVVTSSPSIPGRPEPQFMKGPNAASLASLEALQRYVIFKEKFA